MADVLERVTKIIVDRLGVEESQVTLDASFKDDLGADSLDIVELVMELEDEFNLEISDEEAEKIVTVGDAVNYIKSHMSYRIEKSRCKSGAFYAFYRCNVRMNGYNKEV